jgi:hypothetical protein
VKGVNTDVRADVEDIVSRVDKARKGVRSGCFVHSQVNGEINALSEVQRETLTAARHDAIVGFSDNAARPMQERVGDLG